MSMPRPSFADVNKADLIPNGTYRFKIRKFETREPKDCRKVPVPGAEEGTFEYFDSTGEQKWPFDTVDLVCQDEGEHFGRHVFQQLTWKPGAMYLSKQLYLAIGFDLENDPDRVPTPADFVDKEVMAVVVEQKGQKGYEDRNQVKKFLPIEF